MNCITRLPLIGFFCSLPALALAQTNDQLHTPAKGSAERKAIMDTLRREYTTGSGSNVQFLVKHLKVHHGWAWAIVVPQDKAGNVEGEDWPSLLRLDQGRWTIIDLIAIAEALDDPVGPMEPSPKFIRAVQKKYPGVPSDIIPGKGK